MDHTPIVGTANQIHPRVQRLQTGSGVTTFARQARQAFPKGAIQALDKRGIEIFPSTRASQQIGGTLQQSSGHGARDFHHPLLFGPLDDRANVQAGPPLQTRSAWPWRGFDLLTKRPANTAGIRRPSVGQHEQRTQFQSGSANLLEQRISQSLISTQAHGFGHPESGRDHHRQAHPGDPLAPFDPDLIGLHVPQIELTLPHDRFVDALALLSCPISPVGHGPFIQPKRLDDRLHGTSIGHQRDHDHDQLDWLAQPKEHGPAPFTKRLSTHFAAIPTPLFVMNRHRSLSGFASCRTRLILAKWLRRVHRLCSCCLHTLQYANGRLFFLDPPDLSPDSVALPHYGITMALAGFTEKDLNIAVQNDRLTVSGRIEEKKDERVEYLYRGIAPCSFERTFRLADYMKVTGAEIKDGLLRVNLVREIPEEQKPRTIPIKGAGGQKTIEHSSSNDNKSTKKAA
jgi:hypothetical protein